MIESLFASVLVVALAEVGDKTRLLALVLALRFSKPWPIIAGIAGTTLGMLLANVPLMIAGQKVVWCLPVMAIRDAAALLFGFLAVLAALGVGTQELSAPMP